METENTEYQCILIFYIFKFLYNAFFSFEAVYNKCVYR